MRARMWVTIVLLLLAACGDDGSAATAPSATQPGDDSAAAVTSVDPDSVPAMPSAGCGAASTSGPAETVETLAVSGRERQYRRQLPRAHDGAAPAPLVVDLHGYSETMELHDQQTGLGDFGDQAGFVTVTPQGRGEVSIWDPALDSADVEFVGMLLDAEEAELCIDTNRIYVTGLSNGAFLTSSVACIHEDRIAAVAPVAGLRHPQGCEFSRPVPVVAFHGTDDEILPYGGGPGPDLAVLPPTDSGERFEDVLGPDVVAPASSVADLTAAWADRNGCGPGMSQEQPADDVTMVAFDCPPDATTQLYSVEGGGHSWPGSEFSASLEGVLGPTTFSIDANEVMWTFFEAHPLT